MLYQVNRDPKKSKPRTLTDWCLYAPARDDRPSPTVAATYIELGEQNKLPPWLVTTELIDEINAVTPGKASSPRLILGTRVALFCPTVDDAGIGCEFAIVNRGDFNEEILVTDVDSGEEYAIVVETEEDAFLTGSEAYFNRVAVDAPTTDPSELTQPRTL